MISTTSLTRTSPVECEQLLVAIPWSAWIRPSQIFSLEYLSGDPFARYNSHYITGNKHGNLKLAFIDSLAFKAEI